MIKNIVFDIGNVIWKGQPHDVLEKTTYSEKEKEEIRESFFRHTRLMNLGLQSMEEKYNESVFSLSTNEQVKDFLLHCNEYRDFNTGIIKLINTLKEKNYNVYILSNNTKEAMEYLMKKEELQCIDGWIVSCFCGKMKPEKDIYNCLFETYSIKPEESFFIDDLEENIKTGKELGMDGFVLKNGDDSLDDLLACMRNCGINI